VDLHLLEARKPRSAAKQQLKQQHIGAAGPDNARWMFWRKVDQYIRDEHVPQQYRSRLLRLLHNLEQKHDSEWMRAIPEAQLRALIRTFHKRYEMDRATKRARLKRAGVSGIYYGGATQTWRVPHTDALQRNLADVDVNRLSMQDLATSEHPDIKHLHKAINQHKLGHERDSAMVLDASGIPYYVLIHPYKRPPRYAQQSGEQKYEAVLPKELIFSAGKQITPEHWKTYTKETEKWRRIMHSQTLTALHFIKAPTFQEAVFRLQEVAWKEAKLVFWPFWKNLQEVLHQVDVLERNYKPLNAAQKTYLQRQFGDKEGFERYKEMELSDQEQHNLLKAKTLLSEIFQDVLQGKAPRVSFGDQAKDAEFKRAARMMRKSYTYYLWLLASEDEYGVLLDERAHLYPSYSREKNPLKGKEPMWAVRKETVQGSEWQWDKSTLRGLGYSPTRFENFKTDLRATGYKRAIKSIDAQADLWVPYVGNPSKPIGIRLHPTNVSDYIEKAAKTGRAKPKVFNVAGKVSETLKVFDIDTPFYMFNKGALQFGLISAMEYLKHFDSPHHTGSRLVHGKGFTEPGTVYDPTNPKAIKDTPRTHPYSWAYQDRMKRSRMSARTKARAKGWQRQKFVKTGRTPTRHDPEETRWMRKQGEVAAAERILRVKRAKETEVERRTDLGVHTTRRGVYRMDDPERKRRPVTQKSEIRGRLPDFDVLLRRVKK